MQPLPIDSILPKLIDIVRDNSCVVLRAPAGAGKTTRVPPALIDHCYRDGGQVLVLQPRRVAARAVARRMAEERGGRIGDEVGYHIRFDRKVGRETRLVVLTEGLLVRRLQHDPFLDGVAAVVFDEFHERHLDTDLGLAMCRRVQQTVRPDLRLVVMSATLAVEPIAKYLGDCPVLECDVPRFPVELRYQTASRTMPLVAQVVRGVEQLCASVAGDVLVFLPGVREIRQAQQELRAGAATGGSSWRMLPASEPTLAASPTILPLYGELSAEEQDRVFAPCVGRKIVLATNVAETSITIPGIAAVIDAGVARVLEFDPRTGLNRLELKPISKAAADQRAGRAGRTEPGVCLRLWPEAAHRHRPDSEIAEIHRVDLSGVVLQLLDWGETDVAQFPWFESPSLAALDQAQKLLLRLGACDARGITAAGRQMARLPLGPRLARLMIEGANTGQLPRAALLAALLAERDPFQRTDRSGPARHRSRSDLL
ncbi:MAG: ATP-dependent RNA helicase, partial [Candidatus Saccharimonas sp.]|nr:ATP-dependent RNA helicase [Planctomycetaceae bacterium]